MSLRESLLTREIVNLKSKLVTKTDDHNEAIKSNSEVRTVEMCMNVYDKCHTAACGIKERESRKVN